MPTLHDGREVATDSEEWRHETEARAIMALPTTLDRRIWLDGIEAKRGRIERERLQVTIAALWEKRHPAPSR